MLYVVQSLSHVWLFVTPWTAVCQASLSFMFSRSLLKFISVELVMVSAISFSAVPFSFCLQPFPASGSSLMSCFFALGGQSIGLSVSVLWVNIQGWFPLGLTGFISLLSKASQESSPTLQFKNIINYWCSAFLWSNSHIRTWTTGKTIVLTMVHL